MEREARLCRALAHPVRLAIVQQLSTGEHCVCELLPEHNIEQSSLSKHLAVLRQAGVVTCYREGLRVIYSLTSNQLPELVELIQSISSPPGRATMCSVSNA